MPGLGHILKSLQAIPSLSRQSTWVPLPQWILQWGQPLSYTLICRHGVLCFYEKLSSLQITKLFVAGILTISLIETWTPPILIDLLNWSCFSGQLSCFSLRFGGENTCMIRPFPTCLLSITWNRRPCILLHSNSPQTLYFPLEVLL